ncbi:transcriptional regulator [Candidatus Beckwithbacteria bacterium CG23_combo_of_CG06-09_8_20_14_all_34_8]|uniref:Transcriptional regulator n=1 Tax=Candidatus Beckwithbacteria bacterium CG23_combo_of_CG06-09_8_20_14_all_34_8 TaxID=1974497 RepID=A0A2H0B5M2_9BACT|nr:MAG: transcriptional regulator [Candidatus Beckwithbacteria bacterium CG23_combo_of_CG06-09_8_20_14_all_34_8]
MQTVFKALSDPTRRKILEILKQKDMTAGEIGKRFRITGASISHHLDILKQANLVISERKGQFMHYSLNTSVFEEVAKMLINLFNLS